MDIIKDIFVLLMLLIEIGAIIYCFYMMYSAIFKGSFGRHAPFVSSYGQLKQDMVDEAIAILQKKEKSEKSHKKMRITDLGAGTGALLLPLARQFPNHTFIGYEWDMIPLLLAKFKARNLPNLTFEKQDYMQKDFSIFDLVLCYVLKHEGERVGKKLQSEMKKSCIVISEAFPLSHLHEIKQIQSTLCKIPRTIYIYKKHNKEEK